MAIPDDFVFSQNSLQDFVDCPRRFKLRYIDHILWPAPITEPILEHEKRILMGANFHRYVQQHLSGIPAEDVACQIDDPQVNEWWNNYLAFHSTISSVNSWVEYSVLINLGKVRCMARYDLIFIDASGKVNIVDWKTSEIRAKPEYLENKIQSVLYPFLLAEASRLPPSYTVIPDNLTMMYWFVNHADSPITFSYTKEKQTLDRQFLIELIDQIQTLSPNDFELTMDFKKCKFCNYRSLCERGSMAGQISELENGEELELLDSGFEIDQIGEIEF